MKLLRLLVLVFIICLLAPAQGTVGAGVVTGTVRDSYGDGLPDILVVVTNPEIGVRREMVTTIDGQFDALGLPPGAGYNIEMSRKGFNSWESRNFAVESGQRIIIQFVLAPGTTTVKVSPEKAMRQVGDDQHGLYQAITRQELESLPSPQRQLKSFAVAAPGVAMDNSPDLTALGIPSSNPLLVDGLSASPFYYSAAPVPRQFALDSLQSAETRLGTFPVEFGHAEAGIVNAGTFSGTTQFHGSLYGFFRNPSWNANDRFAAGHKLTDKQNTTGARLSGPILPNKIFFFANAEVFNDRSQGLNRILNPLITDASGHSVASANCTATASQCAAVANLITPQLDRVIPRTTHSESGFLKLDYRRSAGNNFTAEANGWNSRSVNGRQWNAVSANNELLANNADVTRLSRFFKAGWFHSPGPSSYNELRAGIFHDGITDTVTAPRSAATSGVSVVIAGTPIATTTTSPGPKELRYQLNDNLTLTRNSHTIQLGADIERSRFWVDQLENPAGTYSYPTLTAFAQDFSGVTVGRKTYTFFSQTLGVPGVRFFKRELAFYAQDTWRPSPHFAVTYGLRYEKPAFQQPEFRLNAYYKTGAIGSPSYGGFPRIGLAYMPSDKTIIRVGYGWYASMFSGQFLERLMIGSAATQASLTGGPNANNAPVFPFAVPYKEAIPSGMTNVTYMETKTVIPFSTQTNLTIEHQIAPGTNLVLSGISVRGKKQLVALDINLLSPAKTGTYTILDASGNKAGSYTTNLYAYSSTSLSSAKSDTARGRVTQLQNGGDTWYNAATIQLRKRASKSLDIQASYVWSHAIDDLGGSPVLGVGSWNTTNGDIQGDKLSSRTDQRHRASLQAVWSPSVNSGSPITRTIANGWRVSTNANFGSGMPVTPLVIVNGQQFSGMTMLYTNSLNGSGGWNRAAFGSAGRLKTDSMYYVDARASRTFSFRERFRLSLLFEAFNVFNHQPATSINSIAYIATNGTIRPVSGAGAGTGSSSYPDGTTARRAQVGLRLEF
jgi:hypothetical protein